MNPFDRFPVVTDALFDDEDNVRYSPELDTFVMED